MIEARLHELGITLPPPPQPAGAYVPALRHNALAWTAGMLPLVGGSLVQRGRVGAEVPADQGPALARVAALNALAALRSVINSWDEVARVLRLEGYVASAADFHDQHLVLNGASTLLHQLFGEAGKHVRVAVGVARLPLDAPVEVAITVALRQ